MVMVPGEKCPECGSKNVGDGELYYTSENVSRVSAGWSCDDCGCSYQVFFKAEEMEVIPFEVNEEEGWEDLNEDKKYTKKL